MKNIGLLISTFVLLVILGFVACNKGNQGVDMSHTKETGAENGVLVSSALSYVLDTYPDAVRVKFVFRHSGPCVCPSCKCPGCPCPLGVCVCFFETIDPATPLSSDEINEDIGTMYMVKISSNLIKFIFEQTTALPNGIVPVSGGPSNIPLDISDQLGFSDTISIVEGDYAADFSHYEYGEIIVQVN